MSLFTTRVELHNADWQDYEKLHAKMRAAGFATTISGDNGKTFHLPPAEYRSTAHGSVIQVRDAAYTIAATVKSNPAVLVTEGAGCAWIGLEEVSSYARAY